jgi:hypothetical protein
MSGCPVIHQKVNDITGGAEEMMRMMAAVDEEMKIPQTGGCPVSQ